MSDEKDLLIAFAQLPAQAAEILQPLSFPRSSKVPERAAVPRKQQAHDVDVFRKASRQLTKLLRTSLNSMDKQNDLF